jgi:hypothetical protein
LWDKLCLLLLLLLVKLLVVLKLMCRQWGSYCSYTLLKARPCR